MMTESEARLMMSGFISPSPYNKAMTAFATGHKDCKPEDVLQELVRERDSWAYDKESTSELESLIVYFEDITE